MTMKKEIKQKLPKELHLAKVECTDKGHQYKITMLESGHETIIQYGKGGRNEPNRTAGLDTQSLVLVSIDRLEYFKEQFPTSNENDEPIRLLKEALALMDKRTMDRHEAGVLGNGGEDYNSNTLKQD